tara:strand:+ start:362 stop:592 length:231 start_codon:yes stop_codon:yes gene_type:complete
MFSVKVIAPVTTTVYTRKIDMPFMPITGMSIFGIGVDDRIIQQVNWDYDTNSFSAVLVDSNWEPDFIESWEKEEQL